MPEPDGPTEIDRNLAKVRAAAQEIAPCILPVFETEEGSGGRRHVGSAFVLRAKSRAAFVTAAHVVDGPTRKAVVLRETGEWQHWPVPYGVLVARAPGIPDADIAFMMGTFTKDPGNLRTITMDQIAANLQVSAGMSFVAIGFPGSRTRIRGNKTLRPVSFTSVSSPVAPDALRGLGLDPRVHLAMKYDPKKMTGLDGKKMDAPAMKGMSGGGLFVLVGTEEAHGIALALLLAGVLIEYRPYPSNVVVATRIDCVLDAVSPRRPVEDQTHQGADSVQAAGSVRSGASLPSG